MSIEKEFPPEEAFAFVPELADAYTRLRARAIELEKALVRIVEISETGGDVYHDNEEMGDTARKALNKHNP